MEHQRSIFLRRLFRLGANDLWGLLALGVSGVVGRPPVFQNCPHSSFAEASADKPYPSPLSHQILMFTFDPHLSSLRDQIRLRLADTDSACAVFADETIDAMLTNYSFDEACAQLAESAGAEFARKASIVDNGPLRYEYRERATFFQSLARSIRSLAQPPPGAPAFTGATFGAMKSPHLDSYRTD